MPRLLKQDTIRLIEACVEALGLAQMGICTFRKDQLKIEQVRYSAEIGLIGSSIELAMSSILIQALGKKIIYRDYKLGKYKTASEILSDFRSLIKQASTNTLFLVNDISNPEEHFKKLLDLTNRFQLIITSRANGLHNGYGLKYKIVASFFQDVSDFVKLIGLSNNFKPYLTCVPELVGIQIDKKVLIDQIYQELQQTNNTEDQRNLISSLFLILPEIPNNLPSWIEKFDSIKIAPKKNDIVYLIDALEKANPVSLNKVTDGSQSLNVNIVGRDVEGAIPISAQFLKSEYTQIKDQVYSDIATANGRLKNRQLDLPPKSSINNVFALGLRDSKILESDAKFTGHQSWPFIVEALNVSKSNTTSPYWFLIRETNDLGQLKASLKKAQKLGNSSLKKNITIVLGGIEALENNTPIESTSVFINNIFEDVERFNNELERVEGVYKKNGLHGLSDDYKIEFEQLFSENISISDLLQKIFGDDAIKLSDKKYWVAKLTLIMPEIQDLPLLASILEKADFNNAHTNIRKVFRAYDFNTYGPKIKSA
jgi:hypothetical protein